MNKYVLFERYSIQNHMITMTTISLTSLSIVKDPKPCFVLRYFDKITSKNRKRIIPIKYKFINADDHKLNLICDQIITRHFQFVNEIPKQHFIKLLKMIIDEHENQENKLEVKKKYEKIDQDFADQDFADEIDVFEDDDEFVF